jgi:hypothetical protein
MTISPFQSLRCITGYVEQILGSHIAGSVTDSDVLQDLKETVDEFIAAISFCHDLFFYRESFCSLALLLSGSERTIEA